MEQLTGDTEPLKNPLDAILHIPLDATEFATENFRYYVMRDPRKLPLDRYIAFERKVIELSFKADFPFLLSKMGFAMQHCTQDNYMIAYVTLFNLMQGITDDEMKVPICVSFSTLFMVRQDEDFKKYDPVLQKDKILDWREAGISADFFLQFTNGMLESYNEHYQAISNLFSEIPENSQMRAERQRSMIKQQNGNPYLEQ